MRIGAFEVYEPLPELREPHALAMLRPWVDVGNVGTLVISQLEAQFKAKDMGKLARPGNFFDFTRYRPVIYFSEGERQVLVPNTYVTYGKQKSGNDFLFLHLMEPHNHGETYIESILQLMARFGVKRYCLLGSMYDFVPHTKPLLVTGAAVGKNTQGDLEKLGIEPSGYQGPTTITVLISQRAPSIGIETMSLIVHLPQYTELDEDYAGTVQLMEALGSLYQITTDALYVKKAQEQLEQINIALDRNPQLKSIVEQLESHYEARTKWEKEEKAPGLSPEVEKFLMEMDRRFRENR